MLLLLLLSPPSCSGWLAGAGGPNCSERAYIRHHRITICTCVANPAQGHGAGADWDYLKVVGPFVILLAPPAEEQLTSFSIYLHLDEAVRELASVGVNCFLDQLAQQVGGRGLCTVTYTFS